MEIRKRSAEGLLRMLANVNIQAKIQARVTFKELTEMIHGGAL